MIRMDGVVNVGTIPALDKTLAFLSARMETIAENIANADTPGYRTKRLDAAKFQRALQRAMDERDPTPGSALRISASDEFRETAGGRLIFTPIHRPQENIFFHDRSDMRIEEQMKDLAETTMMHQAVVELLKGHYDGLKKAINGRNI